MSQQKNKVFSLDNLTIRLSTVCEGKTIVLCHGVFDLLHIGHIRYFQHAKAAGDILVVTVTPDRYVNKGPNRPAFTEKLRAEAIAALDFVDYVAINEWPTAIETIRLLKPDIYAKGSEYRNPENDLTGMIVEEERAVKQHNGTILFTEDIVFSSSTLINRYMADYSDEVRSFFETFKTEYSADAVLSYVQNTQKLKVLVIGETIIDEYQYCQPIGMATKEPILTVQYQSAEVFAGGILAAANHVASFCDSVDLITMIGAESPYDQVIQTQLAPNIHPTFIRKENSPTIVKRRFVYPYLMQKMFEVHEINPDPLPPHQKSELIKILKSCLAEFDLVIVIDFGHGFIDSEIAGVLSDYAPFLAVNTQTNSGNRGFNVISKYPSVSFASLNHTEVMLEERITHGDLPLMMTHVMDKIKCDSLLVTKGSNGNSYHIRGQDICETPAFATKVVDRIGAGDAVLSLCSLVAYQKAPAPIVGFIANAAATIAVGTVGHRNSIEKVQLQKYITSLLK
jgi:rfaE bifunctional protein kinase chain/domain/rfaE bifunctional protein nucleotidyltransferase chain/domain